MRRCYESWGNYPKATHEVQPLFWRDESLPVDKHGDKAFLPFGNGRSYGDSCLNDGGVLLDARSLNRFISFDWETGVLRCEAGVRLDEILRLIVPQGWFLPVTPGTKYVTVGGAIANDVHGKNHHLAGTFGCHVRCFELIRSDGTRLICSTTNNKDWYEASIGGLGLTGVILWAEIQLKRINNPYVTTETIRMRNLEEFLELSTESDCDYEYTVAWIDCYANGKDLGRGLFMRGNSAPSVFARSAPSSGRETLLSVPINLPASTLNQLTTRLLNTVYYHKQWNTRNWTVKHYNPFFYPLDAIGNWNRIYGRRGFLQYQCVVPNAKAIRDILMRIVMSGMGSFLAVLKVFGSIKSPGILSFPRPGITLALDFPNKGQNLLRLLNDLDGIVRDAAGAVYPAKDARMSAESFRVYFPQVEEFKKYLDPRFSSSFWRRVCPT